MKKILLRCMPVMLLWVLFAASWLPLGASAATPTWEYYTNPDGNGGEYAVITAYNGSGGSVTIPNTLGGAKVRGFSTYTFYYSDAAITSLTCGSNMQWISDVTGLEDTLKSVNFSAATIEEIPAGAFYGCEKLTSFSWPKGVKTVGNIAFGATGLTSVSVPSTVTRLGGESYGFSGGVFEDCTKLTSVTINSTQLKSIASNTFEGCTALKSIKIPAGVTSIGDYAFSDCTALTTVNFGTSKVSSIGRYAFSDCTALTALTLPDTLTSLGDYCFAGSGITKLNLPDSMYRVYGSSFQYATKLTSLTVNDTNSYFKSVDGVLFNKSGTSLYCYPAGKAKVSSYRIPDGVTAIGENAFGVSFNSQNIYCGNGNITNLYFPDTVKSVGEQGASFYSGNFYFCGDKPSAGSRYDLGDPNRVNYYFTPGRSGWTESTKVKPWEDSSHCTVKGTAAVAPTCTVAGGKEISCPVCGYTASDRTGAAALGHDWAEWETVTEPTCTEAGQQQRVCRRDGCGETETEAIEKLGHKWTSLYCQEDAFCTRCDLTRDAREHNWVEATCTKEKHCSLCPLTEGEALGHIEVVRQAVAPTCTASGKTEGKYCSRCSKTLVAQTTIAATGHTTVVDPAVPATQHLTGLTEGSHCGTCNTVLVAQKVTAATGYHSAHSACSERCAHTEKHEQVTFNRWYSGTFSSGNYYLSSNLTLSNNLKITGTARLCLNGYTLTFADGYSLNVEQGGSLTICDCAGGGQIIRGTLPGNSDGSMLHNRGTMTVFGGTYGADGHGVCFSNTGTLTIYDGTFGLEIWNDYDSYTASTTRYGKTVIYNATVSTQLYSNSMALYNAKGCSLTVYGGSYSSKGTALDNRGTADIRGGSFSSLPGSTLTGSTVSNTGTLELQNASVTAGNGYAINNSGEWSSNYSRFIHAYLDINSGTTVRNESTSLPAIRNTGSVYVYGGSISGYVGILNYSQLSDTENNGGCIYVNGGSVSGTHCAVLNSGTTSTRYQNGVPVSKKTSRGILEVSYNPSLGKVIAEYPKSLKLNYNCKAVVDLELDLENIAVGDVIASGSNMLQNLNLLNPGYVLIKSNSEICLASSHCGATTSDDLHWEITPEGKLTISGTGKMKDYSFSSEQPWNQSKTGVELTEVILSPGITHIGSAAFSYQNKLTKIVIPEGVVSTGSWVFEGSDNLEEVHLPSTLTRVASNLFATIRGTAPPETVTYNGCEHQWEKVQVDSNQSAPVEPICLPNENTEDGDCTTAFTCSVCRMDISPAREMHTGGTSTCTEKAACEVCGKIYGELGHVSQILPAVEPDCENSGLTEGSRCSLCNAVLVEQTVIPAKGHQYESEITPPTCEAEGYTTHTCHCGHAYTDGHVDALGHYVIRPGKELVDAHTLQNDSTHPFSNSGGWYASTNKGHYTTSKFRITAIYDCTLVLKYKVSSERNYDKLTILYFLSELMSCTARKRRSSPARSVKLPLLCN